MAAHYLIVEDDPYLCELVQTKAQTENVSFDVADSVAAGKKALDTGAYKLVAMDIMFPDKSGVEVAIHVLQNHPGLPFIFISAMNRGVFLEKYAAEIEKWPPLAAAPYLMKPFSLDYFFSVIKKVVTPERKTGKPNRLA